MKRSSSNSNSSGKPAKQTDSGRRWGLGTWLNRLAEYVHHKNADDRPVISDAENCSRTDSDSQDTTKIRTSLENSALNVQYDTLNNGSVARKSLNRTGLLSVKRSSTFGSADVSRRASIANNTTGDISQQARTPVVRRFTRDSSIFSASTESHLHATANASHSSVVSGYPVSQSQYPGVGIMPSVKLVQYNDRRTPTLGSHNSLMMGSSSVRVKIAPPDASRSPISEQSVYALERPTSPAASVSSTRSVVSALRENRKRLFCPDDVNDSEKQENQRNKKWRPNHDDAGIPADTHENNLLPVPNDTSPLTNRPSNMGTSANTSYMSSHSFKFGSRNPIDVSYLSSRHLNKQSHDDRNTGASPDGSLQISRNSSVCGSFSGSQVPLYDDGRISAGNSDSPLASAPSSGRNTPVLSVDGAKLDRNTPVPLTLDASRQDGTPEKHRQLLLIKDGTCKRRLAPLCADLSTSFKPTVQRKHSLSIKDFDRDRRLEMERARQLLRDVTGGTSGKDDVQFMSATTGLNISQSASVTAPVDTRLSTGLLTQPVPAATTCTFSPALNVIPTSSTNSAAASALSQSAHSTNINSTISTMPSVTAVKEVAGFKPSMTLSNTSSGVSLASVTQPVMFGSNLTTASAQPGSTSASSLTFGNPVASNNLSVASQIANASSVNQFVLPLVTTTSNFAVSSAACNPGSLNLLSTTSSAISKGAISNVSQSPLVQGSSNSLMSSGFSLASSVVQPTLLSASTFGNAVSQPGSKMLSASTLFVNPTNIASSSGSIPTTTSSMFSSMFSKPETNAIAATSNSISNPSSSANNQSVTTSAFGITGSNPVSFSFGSSQPPTAGPKSSAQTPQFPPVFGVSMSTPQSSTSSLLGMNNVIGSQNSTSLFGHLTTTANSGVFGNSATVAPGFGANSTLSSAFGNNRSAGGVFGIIPSTPLALGASVPSCTSGTTAMSSFGSFQLSSKVNTVTTNVLPFGHAAVNGVPTQSAATSSFGFSGSLTEKSVNTPGNGFAFSGGSSVLPVGPTVSSTANGLDFQTSTPGFKFGGSGDGFIFGGNTAAAPAFGVSNGVTGLVQFGSPTMPVFSPMPTQSPPAAFTIGSASAGRSAAAAGRRTARPRTGRR